jgi:hypothetical protein
MVRSLSKLRKLFSTPAAEHGRCHLAIELLERRDQPALCTWTGLGPDNLGSDPANWFDNQVPGAADTALFDSRAGSASALLDSGFTSTLAGLWITNLYSGTVQLSHDETITNFLSQDTGTINGPGTLHLVNHATGQWTGGAMYGSGSIDVQLGATLNLAGSLLDGGRNITSDALVTAGDGTLTASAMTFTNRPTATFQVTGSFSWLDPASTSAIQTTGTVEVEHFLYLATHLTQSDGQLTGMGQLEILVTGTYDWLGGIMQGTGTLQTDVVGAATSVLNMNNPTGLTDQGWTINNQGTANVLGNTPFVDVQAPFNTSNTVNVQVGTLLLEGGGQLSQATNIAGGAVVQLAKGTFEADNWQAAGDGPLVIGRGGDVPDLDVAAAGSRVDRAVLQAGGIISGPGLLQVFRSLDWTPGGEMQGNGTTRINPNASLMISGVRDHHCQDRTIEIAAGANGTLAASSWLTLRNCRLNNAGLFTVFGSTFLNPSALQAPGIFVNTGNTPETGSWFRR